LGVPERVRLAALCKVIVPPTAELVMVPLSTRPAAFMIMVMLWSDCNVMPEATVVFAAADVVVRLPPSRLMVAAPAPPTWVKLTV